MSDDIVDELENVEQAIGRIEDAVGKVELAVKDKVSTVQAVLYIVIGVWLVSLPGQIWHAKWRYALAYGVSSDNVQVSDHPHDCNFWAAPLGEKYCHYERTVSTVRWGTSTTGNPIISYDEGKTWSVFTPNPHNKVPQYSTVKEVYITWDKKDD
jgi:hypothetical protein